MTNLEVIGQGRSGSKGFVVASGNGSASAIPALFAATNRSTESYIEFLAAKIRNPNTRAAYARALRKFATWCDSVGLQLEQLRAHHVAAYIELMSRDGLSPATIKQALAAISVLCDHLVVRQVLPANPAASVRAPRLVRRTGSTPVLVGDEARRLLDSFNPGTLHGLRDRALVAVMIYSFARLRAALQLRVGDYELRGGRGYLRLVEKGGKVIDAPCHPELDQAIGEWLSASGLEGKRRHALFPATVGGQVVDRPLAGVTAWSMVQRRAEAAGLGRRISPHSFRATGITAFLSGGGRLEVAQYLAGHADPATTKMYDRRRDEVRVHEVDRILI